ncbi:hypothetical protein IML52_05340 [Aggregatibacter actinomycetemcomitans]|uniref:hypothetical protein n=1 Tax=Aggregatibacter actinomycetemcomitans TaxID=714 RepID=UPI00037580A3|nr:hypothetical protein [Aggregatibacter actinomycetemcomitans]MCE3057189.1 hypothetical protein [Aggregatibacter actinomycetemcomitans]TYB26885.1 hypothetical protein FXB66_05480 [Aggregatibacter actinomycetemcomitans]
MGNKEIKRSEKMGRKSLISSLPRDVLLELNDVIRTNEYGNQDEVLKWFPDVNDLPDDLQVSCLILA